MKHEYTDQDLRDLAETYPATIHEMFVNMLSVRLKDEMETTDARKDVAQWLANEFYGSMRDMATVMKNPLVEMANLLRQLLELKRQEHFIHEEYSLAGSEPMLVVPVSIQTRNRR